MKRTKQILNGWWDYRIADGRYTKKQIPYSDPPVGFAECRTTFDQSPDGVGKRAFLVLEGITYSAEVSFNGVTLGKMLPYCEYRYEITELIKSESNVLSVVIRDTEIVFGAGEGWENYSGITRDVYIEYTNESRIENVFFHNTVNEEMTVADCMAEIKIDGYKDGLSAKVALLDRGGRVAFSDTVALDGEKTDIAWRIEEPANCASPCILPIVSVIP